MPGKETLLVAGRQYEELSWKWRLNRLVLEVASLTRNQSRGLGGATFDEKSVPPWTRGDFRGVLGRNSQLGVGCRSGNPPRRFAPPLRRRGFSKKHHRSGVSRRKRLGIFLPPRGPRHFSKNGKSLLQLSFVGLLAIFADFEGLGMPHLHSLLRPIPILQLRTVAIRQSP